MIVWVCQEYTYSPILGGIFPASRGSGAHAERLVKDSMIDITYLLGYTHNPLTPAAAGPVFDLRAGIHLQSRPGLHRFGQRP